MRESPGSCEYAQIALICKNMDVTLPEETPILSNKQKSIASARLKRLVDLKLLTQAGLKWLIVAGDPWHDTPVTGVEGLPDANLGKTVVYPVNQEIQLTKPAGLPAGNWSCRITTGRTGKNTAMTRVTGKPGILFPSSDAATHLYAPVNIESRSDSAGAFPDGFPQIAASNVFNFLEIPLEHKVGTYRVIGWGLEGVNTTASLNMQGLCSTARFNQSGQKSVERYVTADPATAFNQVFSLFRSVRFPPADLSELLNLQGAQQWEAREGFYAVVPLKFPTEEVGPAAEFALLRPDPISTLYTAGAPGEFIAYLPSTGLTSVGTMATPVAAYPTYDEDIPHDGVIIYFSGLSDQTSLTIRSRWIIERYPADPDAMVPLATPGAYFDPLALQIYTRTMQKMKPAVMFKENPEGEWFSRLLGTIADMAGPLITMIPHPAAKVIGAGLTAARAATKKGDDIPAAPPVKVKKDKEGKKKKQPALGN